MKDEIKEILDKLKDENNYQVDCNDGSAFKELFANEINLLLDYITNLQEENERLKEIENFKFSIRKDETKTPPIVTKNYKSEYEDYKLRNKKAIEYNYELQERYCHSALFDDLVASKIYEITEKQLNILQGEDKE